MKKLVIVESPAKAKTINLYLGKEYTVLASVGHIRDLPKSKIGVDVEKGFTPTYTINKEKRKVVDALKKAAQKAETIFIATDPDREGEAIGWHIGQILNRPIEELLRVRFQQITRNSVKEAIASPSTIDLNRVESQQARRILDRLMGYTLSPLLWKKVKRGLSAGRVQSVALKIVCDREAERDAFKPEEFWTFSALLNAAEEPPFKAALEKVKGKKVKIRNEKDARALEKAVRAGAFTVRDVKKRSRRKTPPPPFTTAKLQQEANRRFKFPVKKTMKVAQGLYEGKNLGSLGHQGLITYMRTDSVRVAPEALTEAREQIGKVFGQEYMPEKPRYYKNKQNIQDAHEAIRPVQPSLDPASIKTYLNADEIKLYTLIYNRFLASQMAAAGVDVTEIFIENGEALFGAKGEVITFPGFLALTREENKPEKVTLPPVKEGEILTMKSLEVKQNFTQPPPRFTEAALVKALEEKGIGRPSTYATILATIQNRDYCLKDGAVFVPTSLGTVVSQLLVNAFPDIINETYTASLEDSLDRIEMGEMDRLTLLTDFYDKFSVELDKATREVERVKGIPLDEVCPECGKSLLIKWGKNGQFIGCSGYPDCTYTRDIIAEGVEPCDKCGSPMVLKHGRFGAFYACSNYPECKNTRRTKVAFKSEDTGVTCPNEGCGGHIVSRRSKRGRIFYGCSNYPECTYVSWNRPVPEPCPVCGYPFLVLKGKKKVCPNEENHGK